MPMSTIITFDVRSGRILGIHHGSADEERARKSAQHHSQVSAEHIDLLTTDAVELDKSKRYKVDVSGKTLVPTEAAEEGVWFGFGSTGSTNRSNSA
jgi:hypothetical protein